MRKINLPLCCGFAKEKLDSSQAWTFRLAFPGLEWGLQLVRRAVRFGIVGLLINALLYLLYLALTLKARMDPLLATSAVYALGIGLSFAVNRTWSFGGVEPVSRTLPRFLVAYGIGYLAQTAAFLGLYKGLAIAHLLAQVAAMIVAAGVIFCLLNFWVFRALRNFNRADTPRPRR